MARELDGKRIAFLTANEAGGEPVLIAPKTGTVQAFHHLDKADTFEVDVSTSQAKVADYDGLVLPGGVANPDQLRLDSDATDFVREWTRAGKPVAAICHAPWTLIEAGVLSGKQLASWPSLRTDLENAGATWRDEQVVRCDQRGWTLISSRKPDDLPAFDRELVAAFA
jgi:protease I